MILAKETTWCYSYHRISTKTQLKGGGIKRQLDASNEFCKEQGWTMDTSFKLTDIGRSAFHGKNLDDKAALGGFLKAVDNGQIRRPAVLLVESIDRLSRAAILDALELFMRILNAGITICTYIDRNIYSKEDIQKNFSPLLISITLMCRSHEESQTKSKRIKISWNHRREKIKNGEIAHKGIYPDWIDVSSGKPVVVESRANFVREIFNLAINENMSYASIVKTMKEQYGNDLKISPNWINRLFYKKRVLGIYEPCEVVQTGSSSRYIPTYEEIEAYPAIIDEETFFKAQASVQNRKKVRSGRPSKREINFFVSFLYCGCCGSAITMYGAGSRTHTYRCRRRDRYKDDCGQRSSLAVKHFQPVLLSALSLVDNDDMLEAASNRKKTKLQDELKIKTLLLEDKTNRINNLAELLASGSKKGIDMVITLEKETEALKHEISVLNQELQILESSVMASSIEQINTFHIRFQLGKASIEDKDRFADALNNVVKKIIINNPKTKEQRTNFELILHSGVTIHAEVDKKYEADFFNRGKRIGRYTP